MTSHPHASDTAPVAGAASRCPFSGTPARASEWSPDRNETFGSAHLDYARLRAENPFPWSNDYGGFWAATTYEDVLAVTQNDDLFSTAKQNVVPHVPRSSRRPPLHFDPPEHTEYRHAIDPVFRRSVVMSHREAFADSAQTLLRELVDHPNPDAVRDFAAPFVMDVFAAVLGVPQGLTREIREVGVRYGFAIQDMDDAVIAECSSRLYEIAETVYWERVQQDADPDRDLVAGLRRAAQDPSNGITDTTAIATVRQLIVAGMGAPQAVLGSTIVHLAQDQDLQQHLRDHPVDLPAAIEEFLRLHSPYRVFARTAKQDTQVHGRTVRQDEPIALIYPSANRDPARFDRPDEFILHRKQNSHMAFGRGSHRCPAATMGRLELLIGLETLLRHTKGFELAGEVTMMNWLEYGPRSVPLVVHGMEK